MTAVTVQNVKPFKMSSLRSNLLKTAPTRLYSSYEIPERYRNSFYLANASFFDSVNWYLHRAYELSFPKIVSQVQEKHPQLTSQEASSRILNVIDTLDQCNSIIDVRFPIKRDNGHREIVRGFRAQHGLFSGFGTCLGGLKIKEDITRDHMKGLSVLSTYKHSCMGIRLSGAHGGIKIDPKNYSEGELKQIVQNYASELHQKGFCNGVGDVIEPDLNSGKREMAWIASFFQDKFKDSNAGFNFVVGKPRELGGVETHYKAASQGVYFALDYFLNNEKILSEINLEKGLKKKTYIIQGLGKLGATLARYLENSEVTCVGVKELDCFIYNPDGISIKKVLEHKENFGSLINFDKAKPIVNDEIFTQECDILILAANQKSLICYTAPKVKAKVIVEAANGGLMPSAHRILVGHSKLVLPDLYVCSGYSIASYLEYLLNLNKDVRVIRGIYKNLLSTFNISEKTKQVVSSSTTEKIVGCEMEPDVLTYAIEHVMTETANEIIEIARECNLGLDLRTAAYIKAIQNIHSSILDSQMY